MPEPEKRGRGIVSVACRLGSVRCTGRGRLPGGTFRRTGVPASPQRVVRARDAQRDLRPRSAPTTETPSQSLRRARVGGRIRVAPVERHGRLGRNRRLVIRCRAPSAPCDLPGEALRLVPVVRGGSGARGIVLEAKAADRRQRRRLL